MKVPNAENAIVDIRKLRDYCLNPNHEVGKHKARVFASALNLTNKNAVEFQTVLLEAVTIFDAKSEDLMNTDSITRLISSLNGKTNALLSEAVES